MTYAKEKDVDFPSMPMDNIDTDFWVYNAGWRATTRAGPSPGWRSPAASPAVDHYMDNANKPNRTVMEAGTDADDPQLGRPTPISIWTPGRRSSLKTGLDVTNLTRDATRTRHDPGQRRHLITTASGPTPSRRPAAVSPRWKSRWPRRPA